MNEFFQTHIGRLIEIAVVLGVTIIVSIAERFVYKHLYPKMKEKKKNWLCAIIKAIHGPFQVFIWFFGISLAVDLWTGFFQNSKVMGIYSPIREAGGVILTLWFFSSLVTQSERFLMKKERTKKGNVDKMTVRAIGQVLRAVIIFTGIILILQSIFHMPVSGIIALASGGGITIGFAAKDLLANFFGGLMIFLDRPFVLGDWIHIPEKNIEGTVEQIGWRLTVVRTFDKRPVYIPNSLFLILLVETPSRMTNRRINETVGIRYDDGKKIPQLLKAIKKMIASHKEVDQNCTSYVYFTGFSESSLNIYVSCYTIPIDRDNYLRVQSDIFLKIFHLVQECGAECAFPTRTLHIPDPVHMEK